MKRARTAKVGLEENLPRNKHVGRNSSVKMELSCSTNALEDPITRKEIYSVGPQNKHELVEVVSTSAVSDNPTISCQTNIDSPNELFLQVKNNEQKDTTKEHLKTCDQETQTQWKQAKEIGEEKYQQCPPSRRHSTGNIQKNMALKYSSGVEWWNQQPEQSTYKVPSSTVLEQFLAFLYYVGMGTSFSKNPAELLAFFEKRKSYACVLSIFA